VITHCLPGMSKVPPSFPLSSLTDQGLLHRHRRPLRSLMATPPDPNLLRTRHRPQSQRQPSIQRLHLRPHSHNRRLGRGPTLLRPLPIAGNPRILHPPLHRVLAPRRRQQQQQPHRQLDFRARAVHPPAIRLHRSTRTIRRNTPEREHESPP